MNCMAIERDAAGAQYFADLAWVDGAWASDVLLSVGQDGRWCGVQPNAPLDVRQHAVKLSGPVLPGLVNAHSHAFQRAIAGLTECRSASGSLNAERQGDDDFWSWRDRMYSAANRITPAQLEAIATLLYAELLMGGYTHVCEFHYLHNAPDGKPYADPLEMSLALVRAARTVGMGLTLLPTLYMRSGFGAAGLRTDQLRFASSPDSVLRVVEGVQVYTPGLLLNAGIAVHSLRAVDAVALKEVTHAADQQNLSIHIHIAEQTQEVSDCVAHTGQRPIEWLLKHAAVNARWNLVHATHTTAAELKGIKDRDAAIVICPSTEANLGDGVFDAVGWTAANGHWGIGSDSHASVDAAEELRLLEYSQRLTRQQRNLLASPRHPQVADQLWLAGASGGARASGRPVGALEVGAQADFVVLDVSQTLTGLSPSHVLANHVFASHGRNTVRDVWVDGQQRIIQGRHALEGRSCERFVAARSQLLREV